MAAWLGVVSADHVARGVALGIAQINHGKRAGLARMHPGDWLIYYSPQQRLGARDPVRAFTALGRLPDGEIWQADEGGFIPWRRRVSYVHPTRRVPIGDLDDRLDLTSGPNWGYQLRQGLLPLSESDFSVIHRAMTGTAPAQSGIRDRAGDARTRTTPGGTLW